MNVWGTDAHNENASGTSPMPSLQSEGWKQVHGGSEGTRDATSGTAQRVCTSDVFASGSVGDYRGKGLRYHYYNLPWVFYSTLGNFLYIPVVRKTVQMIFWTVLTLLYILLPYIVGGFFGLEAF